MFFIISYQFSTSTECTCYTYKLKIIYKILLGAEEIGRHQDSRVDAGNILLKKSWASPLQIRKKNKLIEN